MSKVFPEDENTDLTPRIVLAQRRANLVWLVAAVGPILAAGITFLAGGGDKTSAVALEMEAQRIATAIDLSAKSAHVQADGVAMTPMVRAGIETDAATMADIARNEIRLSLKPGERLEIFQIRGSTSLTLVRWPPMATAVAPVAGRETRLENSGKGSLDVVAGSPIEPQNQQKRDIRGEVGLSIPVDLASARQRLSELSVEANLTGVGQPLALVSSEAGAAGAAQLSFPVQPSSEWKLPPLTLTASVAARRPRWIAPARYACLALGGLMLIMFLSGLRRR